MKSCPCSSTFHVLRVRRLYMRLRRSICARAACPDVTRYAIALLQHVQRPQSLQLIAQMAPTTERPLQRRAVQLTELGYTLIITLVVLAVCGIFCAVVLFMVCKKQRRTQRMHRMMQEERRPFVAPQHGPEGVQLAPYHHDGPLELQGSMQTGPAPIQQLDGFAAPVCSC